MLFRSHGISHEKAAIKAGISRVTLCRYLNGQSMLKAEALVKLLSIFDIDVRGDLLNISKPHSSDEASGSFEASGSLNTPST